MQNPKTGIITQNEIANAIQSMAIKNDLWILPEVFDTGFNVNITNNFDKEKLKLFLQETAQKNEVAICGSIYEQKNQKIYNSFYFFHPNGSTFKSGKRHLFGTFEKKHVEPISSTNNFEYLGIKFRPIVCYDLRFPVWSRNTNSYDVLLCVSQWPKERLNERLILLSARALENLCFCVNVNGLGDSSVFLPWGEKAIQLSQEKIMFYNIELQKLNNFRQKRKYFDDFDKFDLKC